MTELLTAQQMRDLEQAEMDSGAVTGLTLMERAGQGVVDAIFSTWPELGTGARSAVVLCGPGNNGGDGFVIARLLEAAGWSVRVHLFGDPKRLPDDAATNHDLWADGHDVLTLTADKVRAGPQPDVIVDAVFGIGLTRALPPDVAAALAHDGKAADQVRRVAVDCPSGLNLDNGRVPTADEAEAGNPSNVADLTVTFHTPKPGHYLEKGPAVCGRLCVVDIGLTGDALERGVLGELCDPTRIKLVDPVHQGQPLPAGYWPGSFLSKAREDGHKYDHGHVIVFAGGVGRGGAGRMAARAALRIGAGLVTLVCPPSALIENACQLEAVMLRSLAKDQPLDEVVDGRASAFCLGPGIGVTDNTRQRVIEVLGRGAEGEGGRIPAVVLDADALTCFEDDPLELFALTHARSILTPHEGEFGRLFPDLSHANRQDISKVDAVREAAARAGCVVLLKGPDTVIASPDGCAAVHGAAYGRAAPWLATAGAGDVLAGLIAGLSAPKASDDLFQMAQIAAFLHVEAARAFGPGLIAEDLPDQLTRVLGQLI